jgi:hypothetical protein
MAPTNIKSSTERRSLDKETAHHYFIPASHRAFRTLQFGFVVAPLLAGMDKFFNFIVDWKIYLAPQARTITGLTSAQFMRGVGVIEICAGILVAFKPRIGGIVVAAWLWGIIVNLLMIPGYYDIAVRDFVLSLGALALSFLSVEFDQYRRQE